MTETIHRWHCERCGASGPIRTIDGPEVEREVSAAHETASPECAVWGTFFIRFEKDVEYPD